VKSDAAAFQGTNNPVRGARLEAGRPRQLGAAAESPHRTGPERIHQRFLELAAGGGLTLALARGASRTAAGGFRGRRRHHRPPRRKPAATCRRPPAAIGGIQGQNIFEVKPEVKPAPIPATQADNGERAASSPATTRPCGAVGEGVDRLQQPA
jgi:hypothetical protein